MREIKLQDLKSKTHDRVSDPEIDKEADERKHGGRAKRKRGGEVKHEREERKHGGRTKRKHGGHVMHHHSGHVKHVGAVHGAAAKHHAGRKARKAGGGVEASPFSAALKGTLPKGRKVGVNKRTGLPFLRKA